MSGSGFRLNSTLVVRSAAAVGLAVAVGVGMLVDATPATVNLSASPPTAGPGINQLSNATQLPGWLVLPRRSSVPVALAGEDGASRRIYFTSLATVEDIGFHFEKSLLVGGFQIATFRPRMTGSGVVMVIDGVAPALQRTVQLYVREGGGLRSVEVVFRKAQARTTPDQTESAERG